MTGCSLTPTPHNATVSACLHPNSVFEANRAALAEQIIIIDLQTIIYFWRRYPVEYCLSMNTDTGSCISLNMSKVTAGQAHLLEDGIK
jgi:hypothetical protein